MSPHVRLYWIWIIGWYSMFFFFFFLVPHFPSQNVSAYYPLVKSQNNIFTKNIEKLLKFSNHIIIIKYDLFFSYYCHFP